MRGFGGRAVILFLRNGTAAILMHKALYGTAALRKKRSFEEGTAGVVLDALDAVLVARGPERVIRCTDREFRTSKRARSYSD